MVHVYSRHARLAAAVAAVALPVAAPAQEAPRTSSWGVGAMVVANESPYRDYKTDAIALPALSYEGKRIYLRGATVGFRLYNTQASELSLIASPLGFRFRGKDSDDARLRRLSDRDISGLAGVAWRYGDAEWGVVQASFQKELTGHGGGTVADASYAFPIRKGGMILTPRVGVTRNSAEMNNYYFGVDRGDALKSGLPGYRAKGGNSPYVDLSLVQMLGRHWTVAAGFRYAALPDTVADSPMVDKDSTSTIFGSVMYRF
ncbi:MipA/OmpV family protein [Bacillus sp. NP157]|nr:MipA/OmpV family protein [Bacillus sp. NP157]